MHVNYSSPDPIPHARHFAFFDMIVSLRSLSNLSTLEVLNAGKILFTLWTLSGKIPDGLGGDVAGSKLMSATTPLLKSRTWGTIWTDNS